ncbi:hypothetical protein LAZ67_16002114 [Cordylochernes scorpioides]|uniref:Uncharacterized protein n=1 Tax=Cordylochernes scorpioides TaxID=51811 RepID=A0ABY6LEF5_9ARAC|nr:hypothetical protein LAZ67_16002114 [Cordylochernes scorpioides]
MAFLKTEVKGESRVIMDKAAFKIDYNQDTNNDRSNRKYISKKNTEGVLDRLRFLPIKKNGSKNLYQILGEKRN